jgi:transposase
LNMEEEVIKRKFETLAEDLNERTRRLTAAAEAMALGRGGISAVARATGISHRTIRQGIKELKDESVLDQERIRRTGGGRKKIVDQDKSLIADLEQFMEPVTRGVLESPIRWTCKSIRQLAAALEERGHHVSYQVVSELLHDLGYSLNPYRETRERGNYSYCDTQFTRFNKQATSYVSIGIPVLSIQIKKKDVLGDDSNSVQEWRPQREKEEVNDKGFLCAGSSWVTPYTMFDPAQKSDWKNVGINQDTVAFTVASLRHWWNEVGRSKYSRARMLLIVTNGGNIFGPQGDLWKWEMQRWIDDIHIAIKFCHLPSGTIKWNTIEHHLFAWMNLKVQGESLTKYVIILRKIVATTPEDEPVVHCQLDTNTYSPCGQISTKKMSTIRLIPEFFEDECNYLILPHDR